MKRQKQDHFSMSLQKIELAPADCALAKGWKPSQLRYAGRLMMGIVKSVM
jgi:hypothetical protein